MAERHHNCCFEVWLPLPLRKTSNKPTLLNANIVILSLQPPIKLKEESAAGMCSDIVQDSCASVCNEFSDKKKKKWIHFLSFSKIQQSAKILFLTFDRNIFVKKVIFFSKKRI